MKTFVIMEQSICNFDCKEKVRLIALRSNEDLVLEAWGEENYGEDAVHNWLQLVSGKITVKRANDILYSEMELRRLANLTEEEDAYEYASDNLDTNGELGEAIDKYHDLKVESLEYRQFYYIVTCDFRGNPIAESERVQLHELYTLKDFIVNQE
jgi:hypothetical protein